jgi:hypothetical protein
VRCIPRNVRVAANDVADRWVDLISRIEFAAMDACFRALDAALVEHALVVQTSIPSPRGPLRLDSPPTRELIGRPRPEPPERLVRSFLGDHPPHRQGSRAKGVQRRTLEVLEDLGALDDVLAGGELYPRLGIHLGPVTVPWRMFRKDPRTPDVPYPNTWLIPQSRTDHALHTRLQSLGVDVEYGTELLHLSQNEAGVTARINTANGVEEISARYLVGARACRRACAAGGCRRPRSSAGLGPQPPDRRA